MPTDFRGQTLGRFRVVDLLGRGGMGEVYRARDESLGRDLAIKVLPPELTGNAKRVERFMMEARAASALNHPHLTTIYEIGSDPVHYIAMELVQGLTLRRLLEDGRPDLKRALDWILQVADALGAAHDAGVVHRDIKPENLMIAGDGYAKVLDFGVAKLRSDDSPADDAATRVALTDIGTVLGTSGYMSPEQARGLPTDHRTDIFSFGCVIYECVTGSAAFQAPSAVERANRVINDEPAPIARFLPQASPELLSAIRKCLAKDPADRYQSMKDLAIDLRYVRRQLETGTGANVVPAGQPRRISLAWPAAIIAVAFVLGAFVFYERRSESEPVAAAPPPTSSIERLTTSGNTFDAVISPDGKFLVHLEAVGNVQSMWVRSLDTGADRELVQAGQFAFYGVRFSPDAQFIAYTTRGTGHTAGRLNLVPRDGGDSRILLTKILTPASFSPDGQQIAFLREQYPDQESSALILAKADGTGERILATRHSPDSFTPTFFTNASWSPDGARLVATTRNIASRHSRLMLFDAQTGTEHELHQSSDNMTYTMWLPDGSGILFVQRSFETAVGSSGQVWLTPYPAGTPHQVTRDLVDYRNLSITADGKTLTTVGTESQSSLYMVPLDGAPPTRIPSDRYDGLAGVVPLPDGSLIATTIVKGESQLVHLAGNGGTRTLLTTEGSNLDPAVSPDGSTVAMVSNRDGADGVWSMNADGSNQRLLAHLAGAARLSITADGRRVIATSSQAARSTTWSIPMDGGQAVEINRQLERAVLSPDGKWLAGVYEPAGNFENARPTAAIIPMDGSTPPRPLGTLLSATGIGIFTWASDGSALLASTSERFNLWSYGLTGDGPRRLTNFADDIFIRGSLMPDGKRIVASRGSQHSDAFAITGFK